MSKRFFGKSLVLFTFMIALLAGSFVATAQHQRAEAKSAQTHAVKCKEGTITVKRPFKPVTTYFNVRICFDGSRVWTTRVDCNLAAVAGTAINTWCGTSINNSSKVEFGNNYQYTPWGSWFQVFGYNRFQYDANGNFITEFGN